MDSIASQLEKVVDGAAAAYRDLDEKRVREKPAPGKWSVVEILGHLIDSAANNHQRFVRAQDVDAFVGPKYDQNQWVEVQGYAAAPWSELVDLWRLYNRHLAHVMRRIPSAAADVPCTIGDNEPVALRFLVEDYLQHLRHHLAQIDRQL